MSWITFLYTHRCNLACGFVTFARFARLFFLNDSSRKLLLISDAKINNGSWSSDCFFLTLVLDYILIHPQMQSRLRLRYLCSLRSPVFFNDSSRMLLLLSDACIYNGSLSSDCFFLTLVSDYILIHPQIQSRLRLRYLCSLRSPVFF